MFNKILRLMISVSFIMLPAKGFALPEGGTISAGTGNIPAVNPGDTAMTITQTSDRMIADFNTFNIAQPETVTFSQPSSSAIALNRIHDGNPSQILGTLRADGRIFLVNPNGIMFGAGSQVDTAGLLASTLDITNNDFMDGDNYFSFYRNEFAGKVTNSGNIFNSKGAGGFAALLGPQVENTATGVISNVNSAALASGDTITVSLDSQDIINIAIAEDADVPAFTPAGVINDGQIYAGSKVLLTAQVLGSLFDNAVNNSGIIEAKKIEITGNGDIELQAGSKVLAKNIQDDASVRIESAEGEVRINGSQVKASIAEDDGSGGYGDAYIDIIAGDRDSAVTIDGESHVIAEVQYDGQALVNIMAGDHYWYDNGSAQEEDLSGGEVSILGKSLVKAAIGDCGEAYTWIRAGGSMDSTPNSITVNDSAVGSYVSRGDAEVWLRDGSFHWYRNYGSDYGEEYESLNGGHIDLNRSFIEAKVLDGGEGKNYAEVELRAGKVEVNDTDVTASVTGYGDAEVDIEAMESYAYNYGYDHEGSWENETGAAGAIDIIGGSNILAETNGGDAEIFLETGPWVESGSAETRVNISGSSLTSDVKGLGHAGVYIGTDLAEIEWLDDIAELIGYDLGDLSGGPIFGPITVTGSTILAQSQGPSEEGEPGTAVVAMATADTLTIADSAVKASDPEMAGVALYSDRDIEITGSSKISAVTTDEESLAGVVALAEGSLNAPAEILADGGDGFGVVALLAEGDILAGNATAMGASNVIPMLEDLLKDLLLDDYLGNVSLTLGTEDSYGSGILLASMDGDIRSGDLNADVVAAIALGYDDYEEDYRASIAESPYRSSGNIFDIGDVKAQLLLLAAGGNIGTAEAPIKTDTDILAALSLDRGDIYIQEANGLELGLYLPMHLTDSQGEPFEQFLGVSTAANNGKVHVVADGDITVNSVLSPFGGVFLQSVNGSIFAGQGWNSLVLGEDDGSYGDWRDLLDSLKMDVYGSGWSDYGISAFSPVVLGYAPMKFDPENPDTFGNYNLIAGSCSYLSSYTGTIGVGTAGSKDALMSGGVAGGVRPGVEAVTGVDPSPEFDPAYGMPSGIVQYFDLMESEGPQQIWPKTPAEGTLSFDNPLLAFVQVMDEGYNAAVREGFQPQAALTLQFGAPPITPPGPEEDGAEEFAGALDPNLRVYYELVKNYRVMSFEPATPTSFFAYHPLTPTDMSEFDSIALDADAYDFISNNIRSKKKVAPYYGF